MDYSYVETNLNEVEANICNACKRAGRERSEVTLIAVSKTKPIALLEEVYHHNIRDFGENKVQELCQKEEVLAKDINWHMIGHLQKNKVKYLAGFVTCIHSVESIFLANLINKEAQKSNRIIDILIEVNVGEEESKFGLHLTEVENFIRNISDLTHIKVCGLMTIAPFVANSEENRMIFRKLRELLVDINNPVFDTW